uniref:AAA+ ATPase domain-containing protein n=1 Tax=Anopheles farauti TaxID=69004 RepID=A0A182Q0C5_9DIPT
MRVSFIRWIYFLLAKLSIIDNPPDEFYTIIKNNRSLFLHVDSPVTLVIIMSLILITGMPGVGKTTIMRKLSDELLTRHLPITGFYTEEVRDTRSGDRLGFDVVTFTGERAPLARIGSRAPCVGRYSVCVAEFEHLALPALDARRQLPKTGALLLDEIGRMELKSSAFIGRMNAIVREVTAGKLPFIATIPLKAAGMDVIEQLKRITGCQIFHVKPSNREQMYDEVRKAALLMIGTVLPR